jgi:hypothetical protein
MGYERPKWWTYVGEVDFKTASLHIRRAKNGTPATHPLGGREMRESSAGISGKAPLPHSYSSRNAARRYRRQGSLAWSSGLCPKQIPGWRQLRPPNVPWWLWLTLLCPEA